jgi:hypothetical protein
MGTQTGKQLVEAMQAAGLSVALTADQSVKVTPASGLTANLRDLIRTNKAALVRWLNQPAANDTPGDLATTTADKFRAASLALDGEITARVARDPDGDCWPHSDAMNTTEIDAFTARLCRFTDKGLIVAFAERLADKLVIRDREGDDRRICLECQHLGGYASASWRCGAWQRAAMATRAADARLASDEVATFRRCDGFTGD